jgi:hypothetical protein
VKSLDRPSAGVSIIACALAVCAWASPALAAEEFGNHLYDPFQLIVSGSILKLGSDARVDAEDGSAGTELNLEDDLGFDKTKFQPRAEIRWRPGRRHELDLGYQMARRSAEKTLGRTIEVGDTSFAAGADIKSTFDSDNLFLTYRYSIIAKERMEVGVGLGLGAFFFKVGVDALASASSGGGSRSVEYSNETSFTGPTGALGVYGRFRSGDRWYLVPDARYLRVTIDRFTGQVLEGGFTAQYYVSPTVGIEAGVGVRAIQVDVGPKTDGGGFGPEVAARIKYDESQFRIGMVFPL